MKKCNYLCFKYWAASATQYIAYKNYINLSEKDPLDLEPWIYQALHLFCLSDLTLTKIHKTITIKEATLAAQYKP